MLSVEVELVNWFWGLDIEIGVLVNWCWCSWVSWCSVCFLGMGVRLECWVLVVFCGFVCIWWECWYVVGGVVFLIMVWWWRCWLLLVFWLLCVCGCWCWLIGCCCVCELVLWFVYFRLVCSECWVFCWWWFVFCCLICLVWCLGCLDWW